MQNALFVFKPGKLKSRARHTLHKIYGTTVPILLQTPDPKHVVWLTQEQLAVFGH